MLLQAEKGEAPWAAGLGVLAGELFNMSYAVARGVGGIRAAACIVHVAGSQVPKKLRPAAGPGSIAATA
jgi:hypothetical protein